MTDKLIEDLKYWSLHDIIIPSYVKDLLMQAAERLEDAADDQLLLRAIWYGGRL